MGSDRKDVQKAKMWSINEIILQNIKRAKILKIFSETLISSFVSELSGHPVQSEAYYRIISSINGRTTFLSS